MPAPPRRRLLVAAALTLLFAASSPPSPRPPRPPARCSPRAGRPPRPRPRTPAPPRPPPSTATPGTRWSSAFSDPQWIQVDLGQTATVDQVVLTWEAAYATRLPDPDLGRRRRLDHDLQHHHRRPAARRPSRSPAPAATCGCYGTARATGYGYSLWEFQVYGTTGGGAATEPGGTPISRVQAGHRVVLRGRQRARRPRSTAAPPPGGRASSAIHSGSRSTSAAPPRSPASCWTGRRRTPRAYRIEVSTDGTDLDHRSTPPPPGAAASRRSPSPAPAGTSGCTAPPAPPATATRCGSSRSSAPSTTPRPRRRCCPAPTRAAGDHRPVRAHRPGRRRDGHHHPAARRCPGPRSAARARYQVWINISRTDYDFTASGNLHRPLHQGRRADRHQLHADLGPARPLDLQVVRRRGQRLRRHHHVEHPPVQRLRADAGDRRRRRPASSTAAATSTATARSSRTRTGASRSRRGSTTSSAG